MTAGHTSSIETIDEVTRKAVVSIPANRVSEEFEKAMTRLAASAKIKGFRPGKAPRQMLEKLHGSRVQYEVTHTLVSQSLEDLLKSLEDTVVGRPEVDLTSFEKGKEISYTAEISVYPKPEITEYASFEVKVPERIVSTEAVQNVIDRVLKSKGELQEVVDRKTAEKKDVIDADVTVIEAGKEAGSEPLVVELGEGQLGEVIENQLIGMSIGETKDIQAPVEAGQSSDVLYRVHLKGLKRHKLPELTDEIVKSLNIPDVNTGAELTADIRKRLEAENTTMEEEEVNLQVIKQLVQQYQFKVPKTIVNDEIIGLARRAGVIPAKTKDEEIDVEKYRAGFADVAEERVRATIVIDRIAEKEEIKAQKEDIDAYIEDIAQRNGLPVDDVRKFIMDPERIMSAMIELTRNKVLKFLRSRAKIEYTKEAKA